MLVKSMAWSKRLLGLTFVLFATGASAHPFDGSWHLSSDPTCQAPITIGDEGIERGEYHCKLMDAGRAGRNYVLIQKCFDDQNRSKVTYITSEVRVIDKYHIEIREENGQ